MVSNTSIDREFLEVNGARLYCEIAGSGPAVVLIHGGFVDMRVRGTTSFCRWRSSSR
jgi:hypothetical protein